jgi:hypothetical protein
LKYYEIESIKDFYSTTGSIDNGVDSTDFIIVVVYFVAYVDIFK